MSLSRSESRRRLPDLTRRRWVAAAVMFVVVVVACLVLYLRAMNAGYRAEETVGVNVAKTQAGLVEIDQSVFYTWQESMWIVRGKDKDGQAWVVWERKDGLVKMKLSEGFPEARMRERFAADRPAARAVRVLPGWFSGSPVWEIRYDKGDKSGQQAIDFYSFKDGSLLKTYELPGI
jgi:uncharacterized protein YpmB